MTDFDNTTFSPSDLTPTDIVEALDKHIVGQQDAKRAVAIALRNRWRRAQIEEGLREEIVPKNILMVGPTGVGKTEVSRRLAKLSHAPFIKVEATKFTEVGYVGRDVESIIRDLLDASVKMVQTVWHERVEEKANTAVEERLLDALVGKEASPETREKFRAKLQAGEVDDKEVEIDIFDTSNPMAQFDIPGMPGSQVGMLNIGDMIGKAMGDRTKPKRMPITKARKYLREEEGDKLLDTEAMIIEAIDIVENNGIVFIDEIDKIATKDDRGGNVSREGVQRDLLPLIEGTIVSTKYGPVKTDHILFIASGAFHLAKPSDLLPELQGRLPIRVELEPLSEDDMLRILTEPEASLTKQYEALLATENVKLNFTKDGVAALASYATRINREVENIGARRLHTIMEKLLDEISFDASEKSGAKLNINAAYVKEKLAELDEETDLSKFIL